MSAARTRSGCSPDGSGAFAGVLGTPRRVETAGRAGAGEASGAPGACRLGARCRGCRGGGAGRAAARALRRGLRRRGLRRQLRRRFAERRDPHARARRPTGATARTQLVALAMSRDVKRFGCCWHLEPEARPRPALRAAGRDRGLGGAVPALPRLSVGPGPADQRGAVDRTELRHRHLRGGAGARQGRLGQPAHAFLRARGDVCAAAQRRKWSSCSGCTTARASSAWSATPGAGRSTARSASASGSDPRLARRRASGL